MVINTQHTAEQIEEMVWEQRKQFHISKRAMVTGTWQRSRNDSAAEAHRQTANYYSGCLASIEAIEAKQ